MRGGRPLRRPATLRGVWGDCGGENIAGWCHTVAGRKTDGANDKAAPRSPDRAGRERHGFTRIIRVTGTTDLTNSPPTSGTVYRLDRSLVSVSFCLLKEPGPRGAIRPVADGTVPPFSHFCESTRLTCADCSALLPPAFRDDRSLLTAIDRH